MKRFLKLIQTHKWIDRSCMGGYLIQDGVWVFFKTGFSCSCCECRCDDPDDSGTCHTDTIQDAIKCIKENGFECGCR